MVEGERRGVVAALYPTTVSGSAQQRCACPDAIDGADAMLVSPARPRRGGKFFYPPRLGRRARAGECRATPPGGFHGAFTGSGPSRPPAGIDPAKAGKSGEIGVGGIKDIAAFHRENGQMGIGGEIAGGPKALEFRGEAFCKVAVRWLCNVDLRQRQPVFVKPIHDIANRKRARDLSVGRYAHEAEHGGPRQPHAFRAGETSFPPGAGLFVNHGKSALCA